MKFFRHVAFIFLAVVSISCSKSNGPTSTMVPKDGRTTVDTNLGNVIAIQKKHDLYIYPELTYLVKADDVQAVGKKVKDMGGRVLYDPNFGNGNDIKFLIVNLPPDKLSDPTFAKELAALNARIELDSIYTNPRTITDSTIKEEDVLAGDVKVPVEDIKLDLLRTRFADKPVKALGENVVVAVIDTGIDASHPVFQDRVIYWADQTQETRTPLTAVKVDGAEKINNFVIPEQLKSLETVYTAELKEEAFRAQLAGVDKLNGVKGLDINRNAGQTDKFFVMLAKVENEVLAYVDVDGNGEFSKKELETAVTDFNDSRNKSLKTTAGGFARFPSRNRTIAYPLLVARDAEGNPTHVELGIDFEDHGTHVAGIIGGNGAGIHGAAPQAKFIAQKVCSGITCTEAAILRGLVDAFYNPYGVIPDVVNISLGSHQTYQMTSFDFVMRDLAAKFGTVFFVSASNSGPGHRSLNHIASFGPTIQVGAHVSKRTMESHYVLNTGETLPEHNLLFFTSLGPSFTGQMRPNIVAPGSAISSVPLIGQRSAMFNGTSMSSPLAAGATAAMLSAAYASPELEWVVKQKKEKLTNLNAGSETLIGLPLSVRTSLENTAQRMVQYTMASEGYGLIDINAAYDEFLKQAQLVAASGFNHFDLKINGNDGDRKLYDRSVNVASARTIELDIDDDGEISEGSILKFQNTPIKVRLEKVEVQSTTGEVELLTENLPFGIQVSGVESELLREIHMRLTALAQKTFISVRDLSKMEAGKTYVAHYTISQNGYRQMSVLDVVHMPISFTDIVVKVDVPSLSTRRDIVGAVVRKGQTIVAMGQHRYPIAVGEDDTVLNVQLALSPEELGRITLKVYNPDGREVSLGQLLRNSTTNAPEAKLSVSTVDRETGIVKKGIYEVVIHSANSRGISKSKYDLLMFTTRVSASVKEVTLASKETKTVVVKSLNSESGNVTAAGTWLIPTVKLTKIPVKPHYWTYRQLNLDTEGTHTLQMYLGEEAKELSGRIDNVLYRRTGDDSFEATSNELTGIALDGSSIFVDVKLSKNDPLYVALEVYDTVHDGKKPTENTSEISLLVLLPSKTEKTLSVLPSSGLNGLTEVDVMAPQFEVTSTPADAENLLLSTLKLSLKDATLSIPVTVKAVAPAQGLLK